jgi:hypothetical protein
MKRKELLIQFDSILFSAFFSSRKRLLKGNRNKDLSSCISFEKSKPRVEGAKKNLFCKENK